MLPRPAGLSVPAELRRHERKMNAEIVFTWSGRMQLVMISVIGRRQVLLMP